MRRALSIVFVLFFGLGPLSALSGASDDDANLPACCRRNGAHHCAMAAMMARMMASSGPSFSAPATCPLYPHGTAAAIAPAFAPAVAPASQPMILVAAFETASRHTATPSSPSHTHAGRGPPTQS